MADAVRRCLVLLVVGALVLGFAGPLRAQRSHQVKGGQTLSSIAKEYRVSINNLAAANGLTRSSTLRVGQTLEIPEKGVIYVYRGQSLNSIAKSHGVTKAALARANKLDPQAKLREGQRLRLPGTPVSGPDAAQRKYQRHVAVFYRPSLDESVRIRLLDQNGRVRQAARDQLSKLLRDRQTNKKRRPDPRLVRILARVSNHFRGRRIVIVSAYRSSNVGASASRHTKGAAVDLRVEGIPNEELRDYCRGFPRVGVGYYPRSTFVHLDVRDRAAYWVDWSRPGESPAYLQPGDGPPPEIGADEPAG